MKITIDIDDLLEFYEQAGCPDVEDVDDWIDRLESDGYETAEVAKMVLVATELGLVQDGMLNSHKLRLISGTRAEVYQKISQMKTEVKTSNGESMNIRAYWGRYRDGDLPDDEKQMLIDLDDPALVGVHDPKSLERAERYLEQHVLGHIRNRLVVIDIHGGDPLEAADSLSRTIHEMAYKIANGIRERKAA